MWQLTQSRSQNNNYLSVSNLRGTNFRQFGRRLSLSISKVLRKWRTSDTSELFNMSETVKNINNTQNNNNINDVLQETLFTKEEIQFIYRDFKQKCPSGYLTEESLAEIYSQFFPLGDCRTFAKHLFSAIVYAKAETSFIHNSDENNGMYKIYFKDFVFALSIIVKGSVEDRAKWVFNLFDLDKDGRINQNDIQSMIYSIYDLMGKCVSPAIDEANKNSHVDFVTKKLGLNKKGYLNYNDFYGIYEKDPSLMEFLVNVL